MRSPPPERYDDALQLVRRTMVRAADFEQNPEYRFVNTARLEARQLRAKRLRFAGCSEEEIAERERRLGLRFPTVFRAFLAEMGHRAGHLFAGGSAEFARQEELKTLAEEALREQRSKLRLASEDVVFLEIQCCTFFVIPATGGFDAPVRLWNVGEPDQFILHSQSFGEFLNSAIDRLEEARASGGYFLTVHEGRCSMYYPARASGIRPICFPHRYANDPWALNLFKTGWGHLRSALYRWARVVRAAA